jgi:hypothetical protein
MTQKTPVMVRVSQAQTVFGIHRSTLYRWAKEKHITIHRRGAMSFVDPSEVYNFIINGEGPSGGPTTERTNFMNDINKKWCGQTNPNQSQYSYNLNFLGSAEAAPLGQSGGTVRLKIRSVIEMAVRVEMVMD